MSIEVKIKQQLGNFLLNIDFSSEKRRIGILGASGSGKSMTFRTIAGINKPDSGIIVLDGRTVFDSEHHIDVRPQDRKVGYLFQNYALFPTMSVRANVSCGVSGSKAEITETVDAILEKLRLTDQADKLPKQLSGGQQQRVALARIMAYKPDIIMLDEPFSALDSYLRDQMEEEMKEILDEYEGTAILVSHSRDEIYRFGDETLVIDKGEIVAKGSTEEIFSNPPCEAAARLVGKKWIRDDGDEHMSDDVKNCDVNAAEPRLTNSDREGDAAEARFTHFDADGNAVMVDVSGKEITSRTAVAEGYIEVSTAVYDAINSHSVKKGDVLTVADVAGIMGTKRTSDLIPMCHILNLTKSAVVCTLCDRNDTETQLIKASCTVKTEGKTGVEMEALTGVSIALLTIYDMCKAIDKRMTIKDVHLIEKHGGKSGDFYYGEK